MFSFLIVSEKLKEVEQFSADRRVQQIFHGQYRKLRHFINNPLVLIVHS